MPWNGYRNSKKPTADAWLGGTRTDTKRTERIIFKLDPRPWAVIGVIDLAFVMFWLSSSCPSLVCFVFLGGNDNTVAQTLRGLGPLEPRAQFFWWSTIRLLGIKTAGSSETWDGWVAPSLRPHWQFWRVINRGMIKSKVSDKIQKTKVNWNSNGKIKSNPPVCSSPFCCL